MVDKRHPFASPSANIPDTAYLFGWLERRYREPLQSPVRVSRDTFLIYHRDLLPQPVSITYSCSCVHCKVQRGKFPMKKKFAPNPICRLPHRTLTILLFSTARDATRTESCRAISSGNTRHDACCGGTVVQPFYLRAPFDYCA